MPPPRRPISRGAAGTIAFVDPNRGLRFGAYANYLATFESKTFEDAELEILKASLVASKAELDNAIAFAKAQGGNYVDLVARKLVDAGIAILLGHYLLGQAAKSDRKKKVAAYFVAREKPVITMNCARALSGNTQVVGDYLEFVGPISET